MSLTRREAALAGVGLAVFGVPSAASNSESLYGLIGCIRTHSGQRDALAHILLEVIPKLPGCLHYQPAADLQYEDLLWVTEVWESREAHSASLSLPEVQEAITKGRPLIAAFEQRVETRPLMPAGDTG